VVEPGERERKMEKELAVFRSVEDRAEQDVELALDSAATHGGVKESWEGARGA